MPIYAYHCQRCNQTFERRQSLEAHDTEEVRCPHCEGTVEQIMTPFVPVTSKKS